MIRNYLYYFGDELKSDLESEFIPDVKHLKRGINELLNSWSPVIMASIETKINDPYAFYYDSMQNEMYKAMPNMNSQSNQDFKFTTEIRQQQQPYLNQTDETPTMVNLVAELDPKKHSVSSYVLENSGVPNNYNKEYLQMSKTDENEELEEADMNNKEQVHSGHVGPQLMTKNTNKIFKPILNFIGIDAPSGTLIDNLFKEFGSLLFGHLNIKSVHINILGSVFSMSRLFGCSEEKVALPLASQSHQQFRARSFYRYY